MDVKVAGLGALNFDRLYRVERLARPGEEVGILGVTEAPGGSAANTIAALARLGIPTAMLGAVGDDPEGRLILNDLEKEGVDTRGVKIKKGVRTGTVIGFVDQNGERTLYIYPAANNTLEPEDIDPGLLEAEYLHFSSFLDEKQFKLQISLLNKTKAKISFSPGLLCQRYTLEELLPLLKKSEIVFLNKMEITALTARNHQEGAELLLKAGVKTVVVTLGIEGCYLRDQETGIYAPAQKVEVKDTTGAGDAFAAGFLYGKLKGLDLLECGRMGNRLAGLCITAEGARAGLPRKI